MTPAPILLAGGSGAAGRRSAQMLRAAHPDMPLLIGGRDLAKAGDVAAALGNAEGVALDFSTDDLGLGERAVGAVAVFLRDDTLAGLRFAQDRGVPYLSISAGASEIGPDVAAFIHRPDASPVVLGAEWFVGAASVPTLEFAKAFRRLDAITIGAVLDAEDTGGPATIADLQRLAEVLPAALSRRDGTFVWHVGEDAKTIIRAVDGSEMAAVTFSPFDVMGLAIATGAPNVEFNLASGVSSTRRRGEPMSTEIVIELAGEDRAGRPLRARHAVVHPQGAMPLTALGVTMVLERLVGLGDGPAPGPGLYFPYQLIEPAAYLARLSEIGGTITPLDAR